MRPVHSGGRCGVAAGGGTTAKRCGSSATGFVPTPPVTVALAGRFPLEARAVASRDAVRSCATRPTEAEGLAGGHEVDDDLLVEFCLRANTPEATEVQHGDAVGDVETSFMLCEMTITAKPRSASRRTRSSTIRPKVQAACTFVNTRAGLGRAVMREVVAGAAGTLVVGSGTDLYEGSQPVVAAHDDSR
jgi:hypothetical protein